MAYEICKGPTNGLFVCHSCDNPPCCNPNHLWLGTCKENHQDAKRKGRLKKSYASCAGENNPKAKLTNSSLIGIRRMFSEGFNNHEIANIYDVHHSTISAIRTGKTWTGKRVIRKTNTHL